MDNPVALDMLTAMKRILALILICAQIAFAGAVSVHWRDLGPIIQGKEITVRLADGTRLRGIATSVDADSLTIDRASRRQSVPRNSVREIRVSRKAGYKWRLIGTALGAGTGAALSYPILAETHNEGSGRFDGAAAALIGGLAALGFWAGWRTDRASDKITILPD
jgi:hypothetical protein